tara:strand:+ start:154 stop:459 length:306 start_codon:yes stop_codon:yes gene_type:complete
MSQKPFLKSRFFKLPEHRRFDFPARYYDEAKERIKQKEKEIGEGNYESRIKNSFGQSQKNNYWNNSWNSIRLLIIFTILIIGFIFIYGQIDEVLSILNSSI